MAEPFGFGLSLSYQEVSNMVDLLLYTRIFILQIFIIAGRKLPSTRNSDKQIFLNPIL